MRRVIFIAVALMASIASVQAAELWDFISVGKSFVAEPKWEARSGKAQVELRGDQLEIRVFYPTDARSSVSEKLGDARITISGTLGADRTIRATCTFLDTDRNPVKLTGQYTTRSDLQIWGEKRKIVTIKEIVFSHPPNSEFFGLLARDIRDE
jgi:hypothetical protein